MREGAKEEIPVRYVRIPPWVDKTSLTYIRIQFLKQIVSPLTVSYNLIQYSI